MCLRIAHERDFSNNGQIKTRYSLTDGYGRRAAQNRIESYNFEQDILPHIDKKIWDASQLAPLPEQKQRTMKSALI
jgi:hypothetical protein